MEEFAIYVGGLSFDTDEKGLRKAFDVFGEIKSCNVVVDRETGQPRGFGFVTFVNAKAASNAIKDMDGQIVDGRTVKVNESRKHPMRGGNGGGGGGGGGFYGRDRSNNTGGGRYSRGYSPSSYYRRSPPSYGGRRSSRGSPFRHSSYSPRGRSRSPGPSGGRQRSRSPRSSRSPASRDRDDRSGSEDDARRSPARRPSLADKRHKQPQPPPSSHQAAPPQHHGSQQDDKIKELREEVEKVQSQKQELQSKVKELEGQVEESTSSEAALHVKVKRLEESIKDTTGSYQQRLSVLKKIQQAVLRVKEASEHLKDSEKELKVLVSLASEELDTANLVALS